MKSKSFSYLILALFFSWLSLVPLNSNAALIYIGNRASPRFNAALRVSDGQIFYNNIPTILQGYGEFNVVSDPKIIYLLDDPNLDPIDRYLQFGLIGNRINFWESESDYVKAFVRFIIMGWSKAAGEWGDIEAAREEMPFKTISNDCIEGEWNLYFDQGENDYYFDRLTRLCETAQAHGVILLIGLFDANMMLYGTKNIGPCNHCKCIGWQHNPFFHTHNNHNLGLEPFHEYEPFPDFYKIDGTNANLTACLRQYVQHIVRKTLKYDNIIYEIINEPKFNMSMAGDLDIFHKTVINWIRAVKPDALISLQCNYGGYTVTYLPNYSFPVVREGIDVMSYHNCSVADGCGWEGTSDGNTKIWELLNDPINGHFWGRNKKLNHIAVIISDDGNGLRDDNQIVASWASSAVNLGVSYDHMDFYFCPHRRDWDCKFNDPNCKDCLIDNSVNMPFACDWSIQYPGSPGTDQYALETLYQAFNSYNPINPPPLNAYHTYRDAIISNVDETSDGKLVLTLQDNSFGYDWQENPSNWKIKNLNYDDIAYDIVHIANNLYTCEIPLTEVESNSCYRMVNCLDGTCNDSDQVFEFGQYYSPLTISGIPKEIYFNVFPAFKIECASIKPNQKYRVYFEDPDNLNNCREIGIFQGYIGLDSKGWINIDPAGVDFYGKEIHIPTARQMFGDSVLLPKWVAIRLKWVRFSKIGSDEDLIDIATKKYALQYVPVGFSGDKFGSSTSSLALFSEIDNSYLNTAGSPEMHYITAVSDHYPFYDDHFFIAQAASDGEPPKLYIDKNGGDLRDSLIVDYYYYNDPSRNMADFSDIFTVTSEVFGLHPIVGTPGPNDHTFSYINYATDGTIPPVTEQRIKFTHIGDGIYANPFKGLFSIFAHSEISGTQFYFSDKYRDYLWVEYVTGGTGPWGWLIDFDVDQKFNITSVPTTSNKDKGDIHSLYINDDGDLLRTRIKHGDVYGIRELFIDYYDSSTQGYYPISLSLDATSGNLGLKYFRSAKVAMVDSVLSDCKVFLVFYSYNYNYVAYSFCALVELNVTNSSFSITKNEPIFSFGSEYIDSPCLDKLSIIPLESTNYLLSYIYEDNDSGNYEVFVNAKVLDINDFTITDINDIHMPRTNSPCICEAALNMNGENVDTSLPTNDMNFWAEDVTISAEGGDIIFAYRYFVKCTMEQPDERFHRIEMRRYKNQNGTYESIDNPTALGTYQHIYPSLYYVNIDRSVSVAMKDLDSFAISWDDSEDIPIGFGIMNDVFIKFYYPGGEKLVTLPRIVDPDIRIGYSNPSLSYGNEHYSVTYIETDYSAVPIVSRVIMRKYDHRGTPLSDAIELFEYEQEQLNLLHFTPEFVINRNAYGNSAFSVIKRESNSIYDYKTYTTKLNTFMGAGDVVSYTTDSPGSFDRYVAVTLPGGNSIKVIDQKWIDYTLSDALVDNGYDHSYITQEIISTLITDGYLLDDYANLIKEYTLPQYSEGPTGLKIIEVTGIGTTAFVAATYTAGPQNLLLYTVDANLWTHFRTFSLPDVSSPQFADLEIREDNRYLYVGLPEANKILAYDLNDPNFARTDIYAPYPTDVALVPHSAPTKTGYINRIMDIIRKTTDDAFDTRASQGLMIDKVYQLKEYLEQPDIIGIVQRIMELRSLVMERVIDEIYKEAMINSIDSILMMIVDDNIDSENPFSYTKAIETIITSLASDAFTDPLKQNEILNKTNELEEKLTSDKYHLAMDLANDIEQLVNDHVTDQEILLVLTRIISGIKSIISEIYQIFDNSLCINNSLYSLVESLGYYTFTNNGARSNLLNKSNQLANMLKNRKLQQSLTKLIHLEDAINQEIADEDTKKLLFQRTGEIRYLIKGL